MRRSPLRRYLSCWIAILLCMPMFAGCKRTHGGPQSGGTPAATSDATAKAARVRQAQAELLAVKTGSMETDVSPEAQRDVTALKQALADLTDAAMASLPSGAAAGVAQERLVSLLPRDRHVASDAALQKRAQADSDVPMAGDFGGDLQAAVTAPSAGLLLVDESFGISCGEDHVLLGYSSVSGTWRRVLRWQAPAYNRISGAFGDLFEVSLLKPTYQGKPVLLVVHGTPWCTSTMSGFAMDTFAIDAEQETSTPFWHGEHDYRRADDVPPYAFSLKTTQGGFEVRASVSDRTDAVARVGVMRYRLTSAGVERMLPIAMNSRESVEEWLGMPRAEAARFTTAPAGSLTWRMFDAMTYEGKPEGVDVPSMKYGPVRACTDAHSHVQVEIDAESYGKPASLTRYFVQLHETGNGYLLRDTLETSDAACTGRAIPFKDGYGSLK